MQTNKRQLVHESVGLYISNIIEAHGGKIAAENNREGTGAIFTFTLPVAKSE